MAKSIVGFHIGPGNSVKWVGDGPDRYSITDWMKERNGRGEPFGLKSVDEYGILEEAKNIGGDQVENWLVFRVSGGVNGRLSREAPDYTRDPDQDAVALCQEVIAFLKSWETLPNPIHRKTFDKSFWLELVNETRDENSPQETGTIYGGMNATDYMGKWSLAAAKHLNAQGYKFCGPTFNSGRPGREGFKVSDAVVQYENPHMLAYLNYCAENPTKAALTVHEFVWERFLTENITHWYPSLWGRFEAAIAAADKAGIPRTFPIFVTEFGFAPTHAPTLDQAKTHLDEYNKIAARFPQLKFAAAWTMQGGYDPVDKQIATWLKYDPPAFDPGPQPAQTHEYFGSTLPAQIGTVPAAGTTVTVGTDGQDTAVSTPPTPAALLQPPQTTEPFEFKAWPTEFKIVTQLFGNNRRFYEQFGLPGHEGVDLKATHRTKIFAVADGIVTMVGDDRLPSSQGGHNYGVRIYINHEHGYQTAYAHLDQRLVDVNQVVKAGDLIGFADSTGNCDGAHLHLTLKHNDAYPGGPMHVGYPQNIVDPTRFIEPLLHNKPLGIDLSYANGSGIDFKRLAGAGLKFAFVRVSNGTYLKDSSRPLKDPNYDEIISGLQENGVFFGNYYYLDDDVDPLRQAQHFLEQANWDCQLPAVLDVESDYNPNMRESTIRSWVEAFRQAKPDIPLMIYTRSGYWNTLVPQSALWPKGLMLWVAQWTIRNEPTLPHHWDKWDFWQFSNLTRWPGCPTDNGLDSNRFNGTLEDLTALANRVVQRRPISPTPTVNVVAAYGFTTATDGLNLRSEPATRGGQATIRKELPYNTRVEILAKVADLDPNSMRQWYKVNVDDERGYLAVEYVRQGGVQGTSSFVGANSHQSRLLETGININPDAANSNPVFTGQLKGMNWVRLVFKIDDRRQSERGNLDKAFEQYDPIVKAYSDQGVKILFIINQETRQPGNIHQNWREAQHWETYSRHLADAAGKIAAHYQTYGDKVAYQIWNEGDKNYQEGQIDVRDIPSVYLSPESMAVMLKKVAAAIRSNAPEAKIVFNGMATGPDLTVSYWRACKAALNGPWPVDALAVHPYTRIATLAGAPFDWGNNRRFLKDAFRIYQSAFPDMPIWITEIGVAVDDGTAVSSDYAYQEIAKYMKDVYQHVNQHHTNLVQNIIWFAWSDNMRNAGMVRGDGSEKPYLFDTFKQIRDRQF